MEENINDRLMEAKNVEWLKNKLTTLWNSTKFCGICFSDTENLNSVSMEFMISRQKDPKSLVDIMSYIFNDDIENIISSTYICDVCTEKTIQSYLLIHDAKIFSKIINSCVTDIDSKLIDVSEQVFQFDFECSNANVMIVLENNTELYEEINDITCVTEIVPKEITVNKASELTLLNLDDELDEIKDIYIAKEVDNNLDSHTELLINEFKPITKDEDILDEKIIDTTPNISFEKGNIVLEPLKTSSKIFPNYTIYKCNECLNIFTNYRTLKEHEKAKHKTQIFQCNLCDKSYTSQQYLNLHYKSHSMARCKICSLLLNNDCLYTHLKENHSHLIYSCKFCDIVYYTQDALDTHFKVSHLVNIKISNPQCIMCLKDMNKNELNNHKCKFGCPECSSVPCLHYKYLISYREQTLNNNTEVTCVDCDYVTKRKEYLVTHVNREHLDHHPFACNYCGMQFYTKLSLKNHIDLYHIDNTCEYCDLEFKKQSILHEHKKTCKTVIRAFNCDKCKASFDNDDELNRHDLLRHNEEGYSCKYCKRRFIEERELKEHQVTAHSKVQFKKRRKNIECSLCEIKFNNVKELEMHEYLHEPNTIYPCKTCKKEFYSLKKLYVHQARHYERTTCDVCKKRVISAFYPQHAVKCSYKISTQLHICEVCGKSFSLEKLLEAHQKKHLKVDCGKCGKAVKSSNLRNHMKAHKGVNVKTMKNVPMLECEICGHMLRKKCDLDAHMNRYHLKVKPYSCSICEKKFCGKARMKEHIITHSNSNECYCSICGKKLANRVCLKMHLRIHTGECPYVCDVCGERFRSSSIMKTHRLKKHLEKTVACPACDSMFHIVREMRHHFKNVHWKMKDKPFDYKEAVTPEFYHLFVDGRLPKIESEADKEFFII